MRTADFIWPATIGEAGEMQVRHRKDVRIGPLGKEPEFIAGVDAAFDRDMVYAAACLYRYPEMSFIEQAGAARISGFPYVPGYLLFLEGPAILHALKQLKTAPDIILVDGQGIAHPRGIGSASHLGILLGTATIGCAKTKLVGEFRPPGRQKGNWSALFHEGALVGAVVRTRDNVRPLFVSPGHNTDVESAVRITLRCAESYRIPEPLRCADIVSRKMRMDKPQPVR
jgi:deoxyribonuclease V